MAMNQTETVNQIIDHEEFHRFEMPVDGQLVYLRYMRHSGYIDLVHTQVPEGMQGKGIGTTLIRGVLDLLRASGDKVKATCPSVKRFIEQNPEYADMLA